MDSLVRDLSTVVVDIEGTTTPISFVKEKLFPYVRVNLRSYLEKNFDSAETQDDIIVLRKQAESDKLAGLEVVIPAAEGSPRDVVIDSAVQNVLSQMDLDRKTTALKQLQGHMWRTAFGSGEIHGQVYDDVASALKQWASSNIRIYVYSSGSVEAQRLLFGHSTHGDLLQFFSGNFDTTIGAKGEKESYVRIANEINEKPESILFLTDVPKEAEAARDAGFRTCLVVREGNAPLSMQDLQEFPTVCSFDELFPLHDTR